MSEMNSSKQKMRLKNPGEELYGEIPDHWAIIKISHIFRIIGSGTTPPSEEYKWYDNGTIPWVQTSELREKIIYETKKKISIEAVKKFSTLKIFPPGTILIAMYGATIGRLGILAIDATTNQACCALANPDGVESKFIYYWFIGNRDNIISLSYGGGQPNINQAQIKSLRIPTPPQFEQHAISTFLDRQTAKIDALIAKKQRLIELLQEKRTALINQAVTKGLNPDAPMKDSGIEWLGEIPAHWEIKKLKHLATIIISNVDKHKKDDEIPVRLCNYTDVYYKEYITNDLDFMVATAMPNEIEKFSMNKGSILITKDSETWDDIAVPAYVPHDLKEVICGYHLALIRPNLEIIDGKYLFRSFQSNTLNHQFKISANGITRYGLSKSSIDKSIFLVPPFEEQRCITTFIEDKTGKINKLIELNKQGVTKLKDYKIALISAAVTGKIDVRGLVS